MVLPPLSRRFESGTHACWCGHATVMVFLGLISLRAARERLHSRSAILWAAPRKVVSVRRTECAFTHTLSFTLGDCPDSQRVNQYVTVVSETASELQAPKHACRRAPGVRERKHVLCCRLRPPPRGGLMPRQLPVS